MQIRYVVSSMIFWWRENHLSLEQECQYLKSQGFGIELWPTIRGQEDCRYDRRNWQRLASATENMLVSMRSRHSSNGGTSMEHWAEQIECAKLLKANIVTDVKSLGADPKLNGTGVAADVVKMADDNGIKLCIETGNLDVIKQVGEKFDSIWYCLDTGHANVDQEHSFREYVDQLAERVVHLHLTDNYGLNDDHEPPGLRGGIPHEDWMYLLKALEKYDNQVIGSLEMCPCMPAVMIRKAGEFLFDVLQWPDRPQKQPDQVHSNYNPT